MRVGCVALNLSLKASALYRGYCTKHNRLGYAATRIEEIFQTPTTASGTPPALRFPFGAHAAETALNRRGANQNGIKRQ